MKDEINIKNVIIIVIIILLIAVFVYIPKILDERKSSILNYNYSITKEKYNVNEYIPVYVDDEQMSRKYLNDFVKITLSDINESYYLLDKDYRDQEFGNIENYKQFIDSLNLSYNTSLDKYSIYDFMNHKIYDVYDKNGNRFVFMTNGVMQYEIYFSDIPSEEGEK